MDESQFHSFKYDLVKINKSLEKMIELLEAIKANQPVPYHYYPPVYYPPCPQPYIPYPEPYVPYQPYTTGGTLNTDSDKEDPFSQLDGSDIDG